MCCGAVCVVEKFRKVFIDGCSLPVLYRSKPPERD